MMTINHCRVPSSCLETMFEILEEPRGPSNFRKDGACAVMCWGPFAQWQYTSDKSVDAYGD